MVYIVILFLAVLYLYLFLKNAEVAEPEDMKELRLECHSCTDVSCFANAIYHNEEVQS